MIDFFKNDLDHLSFIIFNIRSFLYFFIAI